MEEMRCPGPHALPAPAPAGKAVRMNCPRSLSLAKRQRVCREACRAKKAAPSPHLPMRKEEGDGEGVSLRIEKLKVELLPPSPSFHVPLRQVLGR